MKAEAPGRPSPAYVFLLALAAAILFARTLVYARVLPTAEFGTASLALLASFLFGTAGSFGFLALAHREMPVDFQLGRTERALGWIAKGLLLSTLGAAATGAVLLGLGPWALLLGVVHGWANHAFTLVTVESKSRLDLIRYSADLLVRAAAVTLAGGLAGYWFGTGLAVVGAEVLLTALQTAVVLRGASRRAGLPALRLPRPLFGPGELRQAALLLALSGVGIVQMGADRWIAAFALTPAEFGVYAFAWIALSAALSGQQILNAGLLPYLARLAAAKSPSAALRSAAAVSLGILALGLLVAAGSGFLAESFLRDFYPRFLAARPLVLPLAVAAAFKLSDFWSTHLIVTGREGLLLRTQIVSVLAAGAVWALLRLRPSIEAAGLPFQCALLALLVALSSWLAAAALALVLDRRPAAPGEPLPPAPPIA